MLCAHSKFVLTISVLSLMSATDHCVLAQDASSESKAFIPVKAETIAVLPWNLSRGTDGAKKTAKEFLATLLNRVKMDSVSEVKTTAAWAEVNDGDYDSQRSVLPTAAQMLRVGNRLGVDWVMSGSAVWHSRSVWISLGPKTKSTCTINARIVNVKNQEVALDVKDLKMDSTAKVDPLKGYGPVLMSGLATMVSGGPKTPHEQRAVQLGISTALEPWLALRLKAEKIDPNAR